MIKSKFFREGEAPVEIPPMIVREGLLDYTSKPVPLKLTVALDSFALGDYTCQVTVLDPTNQKAAFWQTPVRIVP